MPVNVFDETIGIINRTIERARLGITDKQQALKKLGALAQSLEKDFSPNENFDKLIEKERDESWKYGGRTVFGKAQPPKKDSSQLNLFS